MTEPALSFAFFDPKRELRGSARSGVTLLFEGSRADVDPSGPEIEPAGEAYRVRRPDRFELLFEPVTEPLDLGESTSRICRVTGSVRETELACLGTVTETHTPPAWAELDALRGVSAVFDSDHALLAVCHRPRGALGHGQELVRAGLLEDGDWRMPEDTRVSTVYDADGRQRSAGLELWLADEDFPRRAFGTAVAGTSLELKGLRVNAAAFSWRMEGREGAGDYDLVVRAVPPEAA